MRALAFILLTAPMFLAGCHTDEQDVGAAVCYAPLAVTALPVYALAQGWMALRDVGADRIYPPPGLTQAQVQEQIDRLPGHTPNKNVYLNPTAHIERWVVRKGRAIVYAKFQGGVTVAYAE